MPSFAVVWLLLARTILASLDCTEITTANIDVTSLLQTKAHVHASPSHTTQSNTLDDIVPVNKIDTARGTLSEPIPHDHFSEEYVVSKTSAEHGINANNALLDGGGKEWKLFPGDAPEELPGDAGPQVIPPDDAGPQVIPPDAPHDVCAIGNVAGLSILSVSEPTIVPFIVPKGQVGRKPAALIVAPGGGFRGLAWNLEGTKIAKWLNSLGISAFVLKYRVPLDTKETGKSLIDAQRATSLVRSKSSELDFHRVGFIGFSAGGFLAASVSTIPERAYMKLDEIDEHSYLPDFAMLVYATGSRLTHPDFAPPTFIAIARDDPCVKPENAEEYYTRAMESGAEHELHIFGGGRHGYGDCSLHVHGNEWQPACAWTLNAQLFIERQLGITRELKTMMYDDSFKRGTDS